MSQPPDPGAVRQVPQGRPHVAGTPAPLYYVAC